ncbi:hypothetical protein HYPSUDRAFT_87395 [Hypholoma sublateritium FD-334 SS-4]|uniref:Uncharacterized protein n=1 Tax=Hypholoma sublateritium (strain FD-334 SS-4) TaxID=945553 RepID=A0A0D2NUN6_HYPSF|nr:hypothetical protein HYPSUDRAFT_87395 [Hypholoma sublateritium FD-334 SS-4]
MYATKVFPAPPPTNNDLTSLQRTQLVRKARKIEQLLGITPHLVESTTTDALDPIHISLPYRRESFSGRRSSVESTVSSSTEESLKRSTSIASSSSRRRPTLQHSSSRTSLPNAFKSDKVPVLQLAMDSLTLNPPSNRLSVADSPSSSCDSPNSLYSDASSSRSSCDSPRESLVLVVDFVIPTPNSLRKQKMDRLRKKLGNDVPYDLVFPKGCTEDKPRAATPSIIRPLPQTDKPCPPLPPPTAARARKHAGPRIAHARDSIVDSASIHRARRQASAQLRPVVRRHELSASADFRRASNRLSFIIENPDENKAGILSEYGLQVTRVSSDDGADVISEWFGANMNLWSGKKGHESAAERKRRPSSYRKPAPPVPVELLSSQ